MKRLFIGLPIDCEPAFEIINDWQSNPILNTNKLSWTKSSNWHVTLIFMGAYPGIVVHQIITFIDEAFSNHYAYKTSLNGVGVFPDKRKPTVLWLGLKEIQPLQDPYKILMSLLLQNGFVFDQKPLKPHMTIARIKYLTNRSHLDTLIENYKDFEFGTVEIKQVILYESLSTANGVTYIPLYVKNLITD